MNLIEACSRGDVTEVKLLLENGADVHADVDRALRTAVISNKSEVVKLLLEKGADVHAADSYAIRTACYYGYLEITKLLVEHGADVHSNDFCLKQACYFGHLEMVKLLVAHGSSIEHESINIAKERGHFEVVTYLTNLMLLEKINEFN
jgi:ankyrin repeat protein